MRKSDLHRIGLLSLVLTCATLVQGQATNAAKTSAEAARRLEMAKANREAEVAREAAAAPASRRMDAVAQQARESGPTQPSFAEQSKDAASQKRLQEAMSRVSPEGKAILTQNGALPTLRTPDDSTNPGSKKPVATKASPLTADGPGPKPQPLKPTPLTPTEKPPARTIIDAGSSFFDTKSGFGVFVDDVVLNHPSFHLTSDELEIYMNKDEPKDATDAKDGAAATPSGPTAGELAQDGAAHTALGKGEQAPSERKVGGNIKTAIAKGRKVLITSMSAEGVLQTGMGREVVYDGATGDKILRGWPQIQKGPNLTVATEPTTYFIIKENGNFQALGGRAQTRIVQEDEKKAPVPPPANPAPPIPAPPTPGAGSKSRGGQQ
jgi:lipopolysaccharide export system protein LptA